MSIKEAFQINILPVDLLYQTFIYLNSEEKVALAEVSKNFFKKVSDFHVQNKLLNETKYCFLSPRIKHSVFSPIFREYSSLFQELFLKLPCLLSPKGMTFRSKDKELCNARFTFNRDAGELFFVSYSMDKFQITLVEPTKILHRKTMFLNEQFVNVYTYRVNHAEEVLHAFGSISLKKHQWSKLPFFNFYVELISAKPLRLQPPTMNHALAIRISRIESRPLDYSLESLFSKYVAENRKLDQKFEANTTT